MTVEELQQENLQLRQQLQDLQTANANLTTTGEKQTARIKELEHYNQQLFARAMQSFENPEKQEDTQGQEVQSCEDFAKALKI